MFYVLTNEGLVPANEVKAVQVPVVPAEVVTQEPTPNVLEIPVRTDVLSDTIQSLALEVPVVQVPLAVPEIK